jgi:alpha-N-acetylglucosamine transferase
LAATVILIARHQVLIEVADLSGLAASGFAKTTIFSTSPSREGPTRYAYVFYAATDPYGCSALVNMARLRRLGGGVSPAVDLILIASDKLLPSIAQAAAERLHAVVYNSSSFPLHLAAPVGRDAYYYQDSFNKFLGFLLPSNVYRRIILMDPDCLIFRPPHHLFELPDEIPFAAPKAYWYWNNPHYQDTAFWRVPELRLSRQDFLTSWIMSVRAFDQRVHLSSNMALITCNIILTALLFF